MGLSLLRCDDADQPQCGCPPGHLCWFCLESKIAETLKDLLLNDPDLQAILDAPRMGVVDGSAAVPGQVGEWISSSASITIPALGAGNNWQGLVTPISLPAGDWMCFADATWALFYPSVFFGMGPVPAGLSNGMLGGSWGSGDVNNRIALGVPAHAAMATPTLLTFQVLIQAGGVVGSGNFTQRVQAIRLR